MSKHVVEQPLDAGIAPVGYFSKFYSDRDWRTYLPLLARVIQWSRPGRFLELGAGAGYFMEAVHKWGMDIVGIEGSAEAVELVNRRLPGATIVLHRLSEPLPFADEQFQTVVMNQVIEHLEGQVQVFALSEVWRVLKPGGLFLVTSPCYYNRKERESDPTHISLLTPRSLQELLHRTGFRDVSSFDSPLPVFGQGVIGKALSCGLFRLLPNDRLSATANAHCFK